MHLLFDELRLGFRELKIILELGREGRCRLSSEALFKYVFKFLLFLCPVLHVFGADALADGFVETLVACNQLGAVLLLEFCRPQPIFLVVVHLPGWGRDFVLLDEVLNRVANIRVWTILAGLFDDGFADVDLIQTVKVEDLVVVKLFNVVLDRFRHFYGVWELCIVRPLKQRLNRLNYWVLSRIRVVDGRPAQRIKKRWVLKQLLGLMRFP